MKNEKEIAKSNLEMLKSYAKEFIHHGMELQKALKKETEIDAWVVAKAERATTDLSDITHYLDGKSEYAEGGTTKLYYGYPEEDYNKPIGKTYYTFVDFIDDRNAELGIDGLGETQTFFFDTLEEAQEQYRNSELRDLEKIKYVIQFDTDKAPYAYETGYINRQGEQVPKMRKGKHVKQYDKFTDTYFAKGGKLDKKATYVPKRDIAEVEVEKNGKTKFVDGADLLDGVYVKKSKFAKGGKTNTNSKEVREAVRKHILESVYDENEKEFKNFDEASKYLAEEFKRVADYKNNQAKFPNNQDRFTDYLKGIPFHFEYTDEGLEKFLNGLGINPTNKKYTGDQMWKLYGALIWKEVYPKYNKYSEGGNINRSDSGQLNGMYLDSLSEEKKKEILTTIAKHYHISLEEANEEVRDSDAELLFEYTSSNETLSLKIYKEIKDMITTYAKGGQVSTYKKANWRFW